MRRSAGHIGHETLLQQPAGADNPCVAKPLKCRLRLHDWEHRENPETHERHQVCLAVTPTETEGMRPLVLAQLESPAPAWVEGLSNSAVQQRTTATQPILSECVMVHSCPPTPRQGLVHDPRGVRDDVAE
jgi:hypothetical protein